MGSGLEVRVVAGVLVAEGVVETRGEVAGCRPERTYSRHRMNGWY